MPALPCLPADLPSRPAPPRAPPPAWLQLKLGLNPLTQSGIPDGPYLDSLLDLDLRGGRFESLPQVSAPCCRLAARTGVQ